MTWAIALILLLGALITPWGLARSHGSAVVSWVEHSESWASDDGHGHSHESDDSTSNPSHAHHTGDHTHDHAHALPTGIAGLSEATAVWQAWPVHSGPGPSLDGPERPPRA